MSRNAALLFCWALFFAGPSLAASLSGQAVDSARTLAGRSPNLYAVSVHSNVGPTDSTWSIEGSVAVWRETITAPGTDKIGLFAPGVVLPVGSTLTMKSAAHTETLTRTDVGRSLSTPLMTGNAVSLELRVPAKSVKAVRFQITSIDVTPARKLVTPKAAPVDCSDDVNFECKHDATNDLASRATGAVFIRTNTATFVCTGQLINPIGGADVNYFITATHCTNNETVIDYRVYWNASADCGDPDFAKTSYLDYATSSTVGAVKVMSYNDVSLYRLSSVPASANGWRAGFNASSSLPVSNYFTVHHGSGASKQWTRDTDGSLLAANYVGVGPSWVVISEFTKGDGLTRGGSSGTSLFDGDQRIVGTLYGGEYESCSNYSDGSSQDLYSAFHAAWDGGGTSATALKFWLDPNSTGQLTNTGAQVTAVVPVNGACGDAQDVNTNTYPARGLCAAGVAMATDSVATDGTYNWTCDGANGGATASCSAPKVSPITGSCGSAAGVASRDYPASGHCATGTHSSLDIAGADGSFNWLCSGSNGGTNESCAAPKIMPVDGDCGSANGSYSESFPNNGLCAYGSIAVLDQSGSDGTYDWSCSGTNGGATAQCSATRAPTASCGSANRQTLTAFPAADEACGVGALTATDSAGSDGTYNWACATAQSSASCSANVQQISQPPANGACGSAAGSASPYFPMSNLCVAGSPTSTDTTGGDGYYNWNCSGSNGGANASCDAPVLTSSTPDEAKKSGGGFFSALSVAMLLIGGLVRARCTGGATCKVGARFRRMPQVGLPRSQIH